MFGLKNLLSPQLFSAAEEREAIANTIVFDKLFAAQANDLDKWISGRVHISPATKPNRRRSLMLTMIMLTGKCNANCEVCYTAQREHEKFLTWPEIKEIIDQCLNLGSRTVYVAGEGEPTLDPVFFRLVDYVKKVGTRLLVFTNGIILSNDDAAQEQWGMTGEEIVKRLADSPVWIYHKFWSTDPVKNAEMMGLDSTDTLPYCMYPSNSSQKIKMPLGLRRMLEYFPRERVGVQVIAERRNAEELLETILPFIKDSGVKSYIEPVIHSGRNFKNHRFDPPQELYEKIQPYMVRQNCTRVAYMFAVHNNGFATPGISILPEFLELVPGYQDLNLRNPEGTIKDIFTLRHTHPFLVKARYCIKGCLCEEFNLKVADLISNGNISIKQRECLKYEDILY
jgi:hypothetical protein